MSFGKRLKNTAKGYVNGGVVGAAVGAALPTSSGIKGKNSFSYITPFGQIKYKSDRATYQPIYTDAQKQGLDTADKATVDVLQALKSANQPGSEYINALNNLPDNLNIQDYFNNPFREASRQLLSMPIEQKFNLDRQKLSDDLNATNQVGSSYATLRQNQLDQNYNQDLQAADLQAIKASSDAYQAMIAQKQERVKLFQQHYNNLLNQLSGFQNYYTNLRDQGAAVSASFTGRR